MAKSSRPWSDPLAITLLVVFVATIYGARLAHQPIVGEESRWATAAREMLATGDWIVPRQQGQVFPERPPMTIWAIAATGYVRGAVDPIAIRLPSVIAVVLTSLLIYGYARAFLTGFAAMVAALAYATFGQVLQIGRMGESEALFALLVSASLFFWHLGYTRHWPPLATWSVGFGCAALAALVKGPQAPVYFVAITGMYLAVRRDWRYLLNWQPFAGAIVFAAIVAAWQIPFYLATDGPTVAATWAGLAADRVQLGGLLEHLATYPLETFACLLPWSPLLVALLSRQTRELLADQKPLVTFLAVALVVAYPTVWIAAGARGRYFMPLYPLVAVLVGLVIDRCSLAEPGRYPRRAWHQFLLLWTTLIAACGLAVAVASLMALEFGGELRVQQVLGLAFCGLAIFAATILWRSYRAGSKLARLAAVTTIASFVGLAYVGLKISYDAARWNDPTRAVAALKSYIPPHEALVSLSPIEHRFAYYYNAPIAELPWPNDARDLPPEADYFCFMRSPGDTAASRTAGRGRTWTTTSGMLPFAWEEIASVCVERRERGANDRTVVLGRVVRPLHGIASDATVPQLHHVNVASGVQTNSAHQ
jgi:4-amino-4-deoxy-L-arabinose transferase-like glycosyltransferase